MGDVPCVRRITGPDEPGRLLHHLGLTDGRSIANPNPRPLSLAKDRDATVSRPPLESRGGGPGER